MDQITGTLLALTLGVVLGAMACWALLRARSTQSAGEHPALVHARHAAELAESRAHAADASSELSSRLAGAEATERALRERLRDLECQFDEVIERHQTERAASEARAREESQVLQVLAPVQESLRSMQLKVSELETQRHRQHGELSEQLRSAAESEERLRSTADSLSAALKSNSTRGVWGETQLRTVVEAAGLLQRVDFDLQTSILGDRGIARPDMVITLPGGKSIAVDAKVPFTSYLEANAIPVTADDASITRRSELMKKHVKAVRDHITALGSKAYWNGLESSPEMVIAFIPSESLLSSALEEDPTILEFAFAKRVALASPVTLFSVLKTVAISWQHAVVTEEAKTLFDVSRELYGRLATMAGHVEKLGRSVRSTVNDYNRFVGSLERQVLPSARKLTALDESKVLPAFEGIEESPRELTAPELTSPRPASVDRQSPEPAYPTWSEDGASSEERATAGIHASVVRQELDALNELGVGRDDLSDAAAEPARVGRVASVIDGSSIRESA